MALPIAEKVRTQVFDRAQPGLPLKMGSGATMTHDCKRNGTLFAAPTLLKTARWLASIPPGTAIHKERMPKAGINPLVTELHRHFRAL